MVDSDALKLDIEALDGTDITEVGYAGRGGGRDGDTYTLRFTSQQIEEAHDRPVRAGQLSDGARGEPEFDLDDRDAGSTDRMVDVPNGPPTRTRRSTFAAGKSPPLPTKRACSTSRCRRVRATRSTRSNRWRAASRSPRGLSMRLAARSVKRTTTKRTRMT